MWNTIRNALLGRWVLVGAMALAYTTIGMGCGHEHHDDDYGRPAGYYDNGWDHHDHYDHHDWNRDYDHDRY